MKKNLGNIDRTLRIVIGLLIIVVALFLHSWWALLGIGLLINGLSGWCGGYALFGFSTVHKPCDISHKERS